MEKVSNKLDFIAIIIPAVSIVIIINVILFTAYSTLFAAEDKKAIACSELKAYKGELEENIILLKEEREAKAAYLDDLDKRFAELELQYKALLEQKKRISDEMTRLH